MSKQPQQPQQNINISDDASLENPQIGGIAGRDLNVTQIQGQVVYTTVYDRFYTPDGLSGQPVNIKPLTQNEYRQRKVLLNKVKKFWIEGVLEKSLHNQILIELGFEEKPDAIQTPFTGVGEFLEPSGQDNSQGTNVTEVFQQMGMGRTLLVLGEPGSGKTITLLKIVQSLIEGVEQDLRLPIPVVLPLSSWATKQKAMKEWLIEELSRYGVSKPLGKIWIEEQQLILFLDGLDEVKAEYRNNCVQELNKFAKSHSITEIIVSCRLRDYEILEEKLKLQKAICIQPLTQSQIYQYLDRSGEQLAALRTLLQNNAEVITFLTSPLILSVMSLAYQDYSLEELSIFLSKKKWKQHLFDQYIERMFQRKVQEQIYQKQETKRWLTWLAQKIVQESQTIFFQEKIQPTWLEKQNRLFYKIIVFVILELIPTIYSSLFFIHHNNSEISDLKVILLFLIFFGMYAFTEIIIIFDRLEIKWRIVLAPLLLVPVIGGLHGLLGLLHWLITGLTIEGLKEGLITLIEGLKLGFTMGLFHIIFNFTKGLNILVIEKTTNPNQGIWRSARNSVIIMMSLGIIVGIVILMEPEINFRFLLLFQILVGGMVYGGIACIQHFILRLILYCNNHIPWNYTRFLDYAVDRLFMQKVGGGYIFVHRMLLEHFANMELEPGES